MLDQKTTHAPKTKTSLCGKIVFFLEIELFLDRYFQVPAVCFEECTKLVPIGLYSLFTYIDSHKNQPNVGTYSIHGSCGVVSFQQNTTKNTQASMWPSMRNHMYPHLPQLVWWEIPQILSFLGKKTTILLESHQFISFLLLSTYLHHT